MGIPDDVVSPENKEMFRYLRSRVGGEPTVTYFWDDARRSRVAIMSVADRPQAGLCTIGTLGLSDTSIGLHSDGESLRVELLMLSREFGGDSENVLATCAFNVINSHFAIGPDVVFPRVVELYRPQGPMVHVFFTHPHLWELETLDLPSKKVTWLLAVPISDAEFALCQSEGADALASLLELRSADIADLDRPSAA